MTTNANTEQAATETAPVTQDDKQTDPIEKRMSQMAAQKNEAREESKLLREEMATMKSDQAKIREAKLIEDGELKTALDEKITALEAVTAERDKFKGNWDAHLTHRTEALNTVMDEAKLDEKTRELAMKYESLDDREDFIKLFSNTEIKTGVPTGRASNGANVSNLKPLADMNDKEIAGSHAARLAEAAANRN